MKLRSIIAFLLLSVTPVLAQRQAVNGEFVFNASPKGVFEAGTEKVDGVSGDVTFIHARVDGALQRQGGELAQWLPGGGNKGKRLRISTRLKTELATRASCSLEAWDDKRALLTADGVFRSGTGDWQECSVVMQMPDDATRVRARYYLRGSGKVWSDGFLMEEVSADVPETHRLNPNMGRSLDER